MTMINAKPKGTKGTMSFYGGCEDYLKCKDHQVFLFGGTGAGKTVACCTKLMALMVKYPGVKALLTRDSYVALVKSGVETLETIFKYNGWQIGKRSGKPNVIYKLGESKPTEYRFPYAKARYVDEDGTEHIYEGESRILISSLSNVKDELGAEYDYIYVNQPELISEDDWQFLVTRANGRRGHAPYAQLFGDPNPEHEQHWIKKGGYYLDEDGTLTTADGKVFSSSEYVREKGEFKDLNGVEIPGVRWRMIRSIYTDNPVIWDHKLNCFTKQGEEMMGHLTRTLNPVMAKRLIEGEWCSYEGLVYGEVWNPGKFILNTKELDELNITDAWERYWAFDFGFDEPFVWSCWAKKPGEEFYVRTKLIYMSNKTIIDHAEDIKNATIGEPRPKLAVADRAPESIILLSQALGVNIIAAKKEAGSVQARTNIVFDMLKNSQLYFYSDALVEADPRLLVEKKPIGFENEVNNLRWKPDSIKEERIDGDDHEENCIGYLFKHIKASRRVVPFIWQ